MGLRLSGISKDVNYKKIHRKFESMGENLLLIKLEVFPKSRSPFHWFLEDQKKPPFDIAINPDDGSISYIKFFFQDENLKNLDNVMCRKKQQAGIPQFDISSFNEKTYQIFEVGYVESFLNEKSLYLIISNVGVYQFLDLDTNNAMLFNEDDFCAGLLLKNLSEEEIKELVRAKILKLNGIKS